MGESRRGGGSREGTVEGVWGQLFSMGLDSSAGDEEEKELNSLASTSIPSTGVPSIYLVALPQ